MSVRPGVSILQRSTPPSRSAPTDTSVWFVAGLTDAGPTDPTLIQSMADYERLFGARVSYSILYDALDAYFRDGGATAYVSRVVGPAAVVATRNLLDAGAAISLVASALGPGASGNGIKVGVRAGGTGGTFIVFVQDANNVEVEASPDLIDTNAAVLWAMNSSYIRFALGASANDPAVAAAAALSGGNDDRANIVDTQWQQALDRMVADLGIGQVSAPGRTTDAGHTQLLAHARATRRVALLDYPDTPTSGTLLASASAARAGDQRFGAGFAPWIIVPGIIGGTTRKVPPSSIVAGIIARNDAAGLGPDDPAAGDLGESLFAQDVAQPAWDDTTRTTLNKGSVNVIRKMFGAVRIFGWRSLVDPVQDADWVDFGNARLYMAIAGQANAIGDQYLFEKIDGQGKTIARFAGSLTAMLLRLFNSGDLYGATPADAFKVDTGNQVNTPTTLANNELRAVLSVKMSPFAEFIQIEIVKRRITEVL